MAYLQCKHLPCPRRTESETPESDLAAYVLTGSPGDLDARLSLRTSILPALSQLTPSSDYSKR